MCGCSIRRCPRDGKVYAGWSNTFILQLDSFMPNNLIIANGNDIIANVKYIYYGIRHIHLFTKCTPMRETLYSLTIMETI